MKKNNFTEADLSRVIEMAWEDRTPFEAIEKLYNLPEKKSYSLNEVESKKAFIYVMA